jgi:hypothetical protein
MQTVGWLFEKGCVYQACFDRTCSIRHTAEVRVECIFVVALCRNDDSHGVVLATQGASTRLGIS